MNILGYLYKKYTKIPIKIRFTIYYVIAFMVYFYKMCLESMGKSTIFENTLVFFQILVDFFMNLAQYDFLTVFFYLCQNYLLALIGFIIGFLLCTLPLTIVYYLRRKVIVRVKRENEKFTPRENIMYYRELLDGLTPATVSILDNLEMEDKKDLTAGLLKLMISGHITIEENVFKVNENKDINSLSVSQKVLFNMVKDGAMDGSEYARWKKACFNEVQVDGYVVPNKSGELSKMLASVFIKEIVICILVAIAFEIIIKTSTPFLILVSLIVFLVGGPLIFINPISGLGYLIYYGNKRSNIIRTYEGDLIKGRIDGLKRFIEDYTSLDEKDKK